MENLEEIKKLYQEIIKSKDKEIEDLKKNHRQYYKEKL